MANEDWSPSPVDNWEPSSVDGWEPAPVEEAPPTIEAAPVVPSFGQRAKDFAKAAPHMVGELAPMIAAGFVPGGGTALAGGTALKAITNQRAIGQLEQIEQNIPSVDIESKSQEYFAKLRPGLTAKGWTDEHIMQEARQRVANIARGAQATKDSIGQDVEQIQQMQVAGLPAEAITNAVFMGGAQKILGALGSGLTKVGVQASLKPAGSTAGRITQSVVKHAVAGASIGGLGMGAGKAADKALEAWANNKPISEIGQELAKGGKEGLKEGVIVGAILGTALGAPAELAVNKLHARSVKKAQVEARELADKTALQAEEQIAAIEKTADDFNPHEEAARIPEGVDPAEWATTIIQAKHGEDAALSMAGLRAASRMTDRLKLYNDANEALQGPMIDLPPTQGPTNRIPPEGYQSTTPQSEGGLAPEPTLPTGLQGPLGERMGQFTPPETVTPVAGLEAIPTPVKVEAPLTLEGTAPGAPRLTGPQLGKPLGQIERGGMTPLPEEYNPKLGDPQPSMSPISEAPVSSVSTTEPIWLQSDTSGNILPTKLLQKADIPAQVSTVPEWKPSEVKEVSVVNDEVLKSFKKDEHVDIEMLDNKTVKITRLGTPEIPGSAPTALDKITKTADEKGYRVETNLVPTPGPRGGKIPLEKLIPWYEARGFRLVESTKIPEGNLATAKLVREPIGEHQAEVATKLEKIAEGARRRIAARGTRLSMGIDPADLGDHALVLAADMFSRRLRNRAEIESWVVQKWGEVAKPVVDKLIVAAQKHYIRMFKTPAKAEKNLQTLLALGESGKHGANWYEGTADWAKKKFGEDADMMLRFLAVTSANGQTESGAAMAIKAFAQWKAGMPFEGFRGDSMVGQLERIVKGENLGEFTKIQNFYDALKGDENAVVLDRWMIDALGLKDKGGALREKDYRIYAQAVKDLAKMNEMTPRQFQAAVWEGARVRKAHTTEQTGGRFLTTKSGSARPLEELVDRKLGGMTIDEYIRANKGSLEGMEKLYQGLEPVRKGEKSGHTFNVETYEPDTQPGYVVSLVSTLVPKKILYPAEILKFRKSIEPLINELQSAGWDPHTSSAKHVTLGVFESEAHPGQYSIDLNITLPSKAEALRIGKLNRQEAIAHLGEGGSWIENINTGYKEKLHGKQFLPPTRGTEKAIWFKQQMNRVRHFVEGQGSLALEEKTLKPPTVQIKTDKTSEIMSDKIGKMLKPVSPKATFSTGRRSGAPVWMTPDGKMYEGRSHEAVSGPVAKAAGLSEKKSGYKGLGRWDNHVLLTNGFLRVQMFPERMSIQISSPPSAAQRATIAQMAKGRDFVGVVTSADGTKELGPFDSPSKLFNAAKE